MAAGEESNISELSQDSLDMDEISPLVAGKPGYTVSSDIEAHGATSHQLSSWISRRITGKRIMLRNDPRDEQQSLLQRAALPCATILVFMFMTALSLHTLESFSLLEDSLLSRFGAFRPLVQRSNWFNDNGYLDFDLQTGWNTSWNTIVPTNATFSRAFHCDETSQTTDGHEVCVSKMRLLQTLQNNLLAQQDMLQAPTAHALRTLKDTAQSLDFLRGRRALILGDSIDRDMVLAWSNLCPESTYLQQFLIHDEEAHHEGWQRMEVASLIIPIAADVSEVESNKTLQRAFEVAYTATQPTHHFRLDFTFLIGSMSDKPFDFGPFNPDERISRMMKLLGTSGPESYDYVSLNFALWDLAAIQRSSLQALRADPYKGIKPDYLARYADGLNYQAKRLKSLFPGAHLSLRLIHEITSEMHASPADADNMNDIQSIPTFKPLRLVQIRNAQIATAQRLHLDTNPFALRMMGQGSNFTVDTVHPAGPANKLVIELILRQLAEPL